MDLPKTKIKRKMNNNNNNNNKTWKSGPQFLCVCIKKARSSAGSIVQVQSMDFMGIRSLFRDSHTLFSVQSVFTFPKELAASVRSPEDEQSHQCPKNILYLQFFRLKCLNKNHRFLSTSNMEPTWKFQPTSLTISPACTPGHISPRSNLIRFVYWKHVVYRLVGLLR